MSQLGSDQLVDWLCFIALQRLQDVTFLDAVVDCTETSLSSLGEVAQCFADSVVCTQEAHMLLVENISDSHLLVMLCRKCLCCES